MVYDVRKMSEGVIMKKTILTLCIGMMIGLLAGVSSGAYAAIGDKIEAVFSQFTFVVDGETKELDADPIVINGSSYLPVRTVANLVGYDVIYKADSRTIEFVTPVTLAENMEVEELPIHVATIEEINVDLEMLNAKKIGYTAMLELSKSEETTIKAQALLDEVLQQIEELEVQKATLEAQ